MQKFKNLIFIVLIIIFNLTIVNAQNLEYSNTYINFLKDYKISNKDIKLKAIFYDIDGNNTPEMIIQHTKNLDNKALNIYKIYTKENNTVKEIFNLEPKENQIVRFFINNNNHFNYSIEDFYNGSNTNFYSIDYKDNKIKPNLIGGIESTYSKEKKENPYLQYEFNHNIFKDSFLYMGKNISQEEFFINLNFKEMLEFEPIENIEDIEKNIKNNKNYFGNPSIIIQEESNQKPPDGEIFGYKYIKYNNGIYDTKDLNTNINLLMINGNIIPRNNIVIENNNVFLPLRLISSYSNKKITFDKAKNHIIIDKNISINLNNNTTHNNEKLNIKNINGYTYISSDFFEKYFKFYISFENMQKVNIVALEDNDIKYKNISIDEAKISINNTIKNSNENSIIYNEKLEYTNILGRYYIFKLSYKYKPFNNQDREIFILFNKYDGEIYNFNGGINKIYNKINF